MEMEVSENSFAAAYWKRKARHGAPWISLHCIAWMHS